MFDSFCFLSKASKSIKPNERIEGWDGPTPAHNGLSPFYWIYEARRLIDGMNTSTPTLPF